MCPGEENRRGAKNGQMRHEDALEKIRRNKQRSQCQPCSNVLGGQECAPGTAALLCKETPSSNLSSQSLPNCLPRMRECNSILLAASILLAVSEGHAWPFGSKCFRLAMQHGPVLSSSPSCATADTLILDHTFGKLTAWRSWHLMTFVVQQNHLLQRVSVQEEKDLLV